ncbi:uncharacterized protein PgNI_02608 [Pyricularia grisea]|uniref:Ketosynthase family 3 (KS3) domain-containing protein n=1 Tax=Pyricularia grisea TaxID=148305 RepID=A0A6P8BI64_PYRGI|nr:uncharacterized protein PgNI_02608 [Pyricularia grisea]TLD16314.1 hypothetical protein PgNI_02608 [Pyricularia grisea]
MARSIWPSSGDGKSKLFDILADGYGRGKGFGAVILRRAKDVIRDRDPFRAASFIKEIYAKVGFGFKATGYVKAHEILALFQTLLTSRFAANKLLVGSVKLNIGHLEAAAGVVTVIKSVLMLKHGIVSPNIHFKTPNPKIPFDNWNI